MNRIGKPVVLIILVIVVATIFSGCAFIEVFREIRSDPNVFELSLRIIDGDVICEVMLKEDVKIADADELAEKYALIVKESYGNRNILMDVSQNKVILGSHRINKENM